MSDNRRQIRLAVVEGIGTFKLVDAGVLDLLPLGLQDGSSRVVLATIRSIMRIGSPAAMFKNDLERIIKTQADPQVVAAAQSAMSGFK